MTNGSPKDPLEGVRVLELGSYIAAPTAGRLLADFGAEVIKVERPQTGDEIRSWRLHSGTTSMLYRTINRNKKSIVADLREESGQNLVLELVRHVDVVLENFRPGTLEKWGLSPARLSEVNPELIFVRISAYGQTGPQSKQPGFGAIAEATGGLRALTGDPDRTPVRVGVSIADSIAGLYGAFGAVLGLFDMLSRRQASGIASQPATLAERTIDVALNESVLSMMESLIPDYEAFGINRERVGGRMEGISPTNSYRCLEGRSVVIAGNGDAIYERFMTAIGRPELGTRPDLANNKLRWTKREELDEAINSWTETRTVDEVLTTLNDAGVPAGLIYTAADISTDPQYLARGMVQKMDVSTGDEQLTGVGFPGIVPQQGGTPRRIRNLGPELGEHTEQVLAELLGKTDTEIADFLAQTNGVLRG